MYDDPRDLRYIRKATYFSEKEVEAIKQASARTSRQPAAFIRDAAMAVARYVSEQRQPNTDLLVTVQSRLRSQSRPGAANDENILFSLAV